MLLPVPPVARTVELSSVKETLYLFHCQADNAYYFVEYADRPAKSVQLLGTEKMLSIADEGFLKANHAVPVSKHLFTLDGYPGHEIIINRYDGRKETQHTYLVGARRYTLMTIQPRDPARDQAADADKFFNSFTLLSAKTPIKN